MDLIKKWTTDLRYLPYQQWSDSYLETLTTTVHQSKWRLNYHIQPITGLLNDPNGFSYFNGKWHLFYQAYPMGPVHGLKSWYHVTSDNLVDWQNEDLALVPDNSYDSHGVYSGSGIAIDDQLFLVYTGNVRDNQWQRSSYQMGAWLNQENQIKKIEQPLILQEPGYTDHFRDPQIFLYEESYYILLGAQDTDLNGKILTYRSDDLMNWQLLGELNFTDKEMGFMIECPNLIFTDDHAVLLFCPQGIDHEQLNYQNIYPNTYVIADAFDSENNQLTNTSDLKNLDEGFDVYATQAFNTPDGRALSVSWVGLPEISYPSDQDGWAHVLSMIKEISVENQQLVQKPVAEMKELRLENTPLAGSLSSKAVFLKKNVLSQYELNLVINEQTQGELTLFADETGHGFTLLFDTQNGTMTINREKVGIPFAEEYGQERSFTIDKGPLELQIFVDTSLIEIFVNGGKQVATARVFPTQTTTDLLLSAKQGTFSGNFWTLRSMK
ncbi:sucrose-6-phosphate hydrolase [Enterococcus sp. ALS3]|uniref:Sucrose-6-phosphate hydrolase n=1 Tax=Enterococcus alishanensis TaxID=1303817 RepID=A0ABS6TD61_9ENTE|nr:sucrose-6-phosphate hydrolase [Enterococcus alishanensis]MBV7390822.1 sucrose-6-phosphate hydrolase [Enterococcus alishanensis]